MSHFAIAYHNEAAQLGVDIKELYSALKTDAELNPPEWNIHGRQVNVYKCALMSIRNIAFVSDQKLCICREYGYVPYAVFDPSSTGRQTREASRTLEVGGEAHFGIEPC